MNNAAILTPRGTGGWTFHTAERMQMHLWTRKRRLKFKKRWRKQHHGQNFFWYIIEPKYVVKQISPSHVVFHSKEWHES